MVVRLPDTRCAGSIEILPVRVSRVVISSSEARLVRLGCLCLVPDTWRLGDPIEGAPRRRPVALRPTLSRGLPFSSERPLKR